jgi:hypothetical protein
MRIKLKTDESMRQTVSESATLDLSFFLLDPKGNLVFYLSL